MSTKADLDETVEIVRGLGQRCLGYVVDARDGARMRQVIDEAVAELGQLDTVVINHASPYRMSRTTPTAMNCGMPSSRRTCPGYIGQHR